MGDAPNHVISLGTFCYPAWLIKGLGLKKASYPFDWIFSSPAMVFDILHDNFGRLLDPTYHRSNPVENRPHPTEHISEHTFYREQFKVDNVFSHRDITEPTTLAYYCRAVERFRALAESAEAKLFVMINPPNRAADDTQFRQLCGWIDANAQNSRLLVVNLCRAPNNDLSLVETIPLLTKDGHTFLEYRASSAIRGLNFARPQDDREMKYLINKFSNLFS